MLEINYSDKNFSEATMAAADRRESFYVYVEGKPVKRIYQAARLYNDFYEQYVAKRRPREWVVLGRFFFNVFLAINFWSTCLYKQSDRERIDFQLMDSTRLRVFFDFGENTR